MIAAQDQVVSTRRQDALDYVLEAAERGWPLARAELAYLAGAPNGAENDWKALRKAIDPDIWIAAKPGREISAEPRMSVFENCISHDVCDWIVERARPRIARAEVYDPRNGLTRPDEKRTNGSMMFNILESDMILMLVRERIVASAGMPLWSLEPASVLHYTPGQEFKLHFDYMNTEIPSFAHNVAERGQRIATFLIYLNDDYEGGETEFPRAGIRHKGRKGDALLFWNTTQDGKPDPLTLHAGTPTTNGEKWVLSQWLRQRPEKFT
ncbi:MAG: 2OG-Fe(II) oxygenase [Rhizomicrobium sp.]